MNILRCKKRYIAVNLILFAILYLLISFNKDFIRPHFGSNTTIGFLSGIFPDFMVALTITAFSFAPVKAKKFSVSKSRTIVYIVALGSFIALTVEEIFSYYGSK